MPDTPSDDIGAIVARVGQHMAEIERDMALLREMAAEQSPQHDLPRLDAGRRITLKEAAFLASDLLGRPVRYGSIRLWCIKFGLGWRLPSGGWVVDELKLREHCS